MELREPKRKRVGAHIKPQQPFPIVIESENGIPAESELWPVHIGNFTGDSVVVCNPEEMKSLYTMGFFGKGSMSRGFPSFELSNKGIPPVIKERQWQRRKIWMETMKNSIVNALQQEGLHKEGPSHSKNVTTNSKSSDDVDDMDIDQGNMEKSQCGDDKPVLDLELNSFNDETVESEHKVQTENYSNKVLVLADSDDEDIEKVLRSPQPHLEDEPIKTAVETLILTLEEAFFLSYALGCLQVIDMSGQPFKLKQLWQTFCEAKSDFIEMYVSYHYLRAKGWIVKTGYKFGGDFLLYKQGPPFYHASLIVIVEKLNSKLEKQKENLSWTKLHGLNRLSEGSGKDIIFCQVIFPEDLTLDDLQTPKTLRRFQVKELLVKRWISSQKREDAEVSQE